MKASVGADGVLNTWIVDFLLGFLLIAWLAWFLIGAMVLLHGGY